MWAWGKCTSRGKKGKMSKLRVTPVTFGPKCGL